MTRPYLNFLEDHARSPHNLFGDHPARHIMLNGVSEFIDCACPKTRIAPQPSTYLFFSFAAMKNFLHSVDFNRALAARSHLFPCLLLCVIACFNSDGCPCVFLQYHTKIDAIVDQAQHPGSSAEGAWFCTL